MQRLDPAKLHVNYVAGSSADGPVTPRCYTLTHSDSTGDLFLTIGPQHDRAQISGWYTRLMRDEVLAEWQREGTSLALHVHCHVSGGVVLGSAGMRDDIFRRELPLVLETFRYGDAAFFAAEPALRQAPVLIHFHCGQARYDRVESWGPMSHYE